jgi:uncharacterized protein (DUF1684 family)
VISQNAESSGHGAPSAKSLQSGHISANAIRLEEFVTMWRFIWLASLWALATPTAAADPVEAQYLKDIETWRSAFDADIRTAGWLEMVGREKIREGSWSMGASPASDIVLPPTAPAQVGRLIRGGGRFEFEPASGVTVLIDDRAETTVVVLSTQQGAGKIRVGGFTLAVRRISDEFYLNIEDANSPAIATFKGTNWFPVDPSYRVVGRFLPYEKSQEVVLTLTFESATKAFVSTGDVAFQVKGQSMQLKTFIDEDELFLIFQDETNGVETYGGGRFLSAPMPAHGLTTLDFNKAFNPYCAVNPFVICPITPAANRLPVAIAAGARFK